MASQKLLILSVSMGHGHVRAAEALEAGLEAWFPGNECRHVDMLSLIPSLLRKAATDTYIKGVGKYPELWRFLYDATDKERRYTPFTSLSRKIESASSRPLRKIIGEYEPDHIICTHFTPLRVLSTWKKKGKIKRPVWTCITDFIAHKYWLEPGQAGFFVAAEETAWLMKQRGLESENINTFGIPVMPEFSRNIERKDGTAAFGLDPARTTFTLMGGGAGMGGMDALARQILDPANLDQGFQLVVLAGKNKKLLDSLLALAKEYPDRLFPVPFTKDVPLLLAASDLVITKPGGLTTVECLALGKPMLVVSPIPGQEEQNAHMLLENGAALMARDNYSLMYRLKRLLSEPEKLKQMADCAKRLGRPHAARDILRTILESQQTTELTGGSTTTT